MDRGGSWTRPLSRREVVLALVCSLAGFLVCHWSATAEDSATTWNVPASVGNGPAETCTKPAFPVQGPDSDWYHMKWIPPPAQCTVAGQQIERLEPELNFRRAFTLGYTGDGDDRTFLLPYLRAAHDPSLATRRRRVLLDLGGRFFNSSCLWFLRMYPLSFSEIHVFEQEQGVFQTPNRTHAKYKDLYQSINGGSRARDAGNLLLPDSVLARIQLHETKVGDSDLEGSHVNITRVIKDELKLTARDTVIVKMDIEWAEWDILQGWRDDHEMVEIVDELFVEIHYSEPTMSAYGWTHGPPRSDATKLLEDLRKAGYFAHPWP